MLLELRHTNDERKNLMSQKYYQAANQVANNVLPNGTTTQVKTPLSPAPKPPAPTSGGGGGCDTGFGVFGLIAALGILSLRKRSR